VSPHEQAGSRWSASFVHHLDPEIRQSGCSINHKTRFLISLMFALYAVTFN